MPLRGTTQKVTIGDVVRKATANWTKAAWYLKCDVRKFFDSIDHKSLLLLISRNKQMNEKIIKLIETIIASFEKEPGRESASYKGMLSHCKGLRLEKEIDALCDKMLKPQR
jgi:hypothetical protein